MLCQAKYPAPGFLGWLDICLWLQEKNNFKTNGRLKHMEAPSSSRHAIGPNIKPDITELTREELAAWVRDHDLPVYRTGQIMRWLYQRHATSFDEMTDIAKTTRSVLSDHFIILSLKKQHIESSSDGSQKYLFGLFDGHTIETVLIPEKTHYTLCISTQVGCAMGCRFCMTAKSGLIRNLSMGEITGQILRVSKDVTGDRPLTNIVLMGMGEPLANYDNVMRAIRIMTVDPDGLQLSTRRVTLSTSGLVPRFEDLGRDSKINLAISLNATENTTRSRLMPINNRYPIEQLIDACARYALTPRGKITFEYILIQGVNDTVLDAQRLSKLLRPVKAKINLIPFNEHSGSDFKRPDESAILRFEKILHDNGYTAIIRRSKGSDISAACGQLSAKRRS
jgi:23S rRNA (adenine2503-C2)-methyltransferase